MNPISAINLAHPNFSAQHSQANMPKETAREKAKRQARKLNTLQRSPPVTKAKTTTRVFNALTS